MKTDIVSGVPRARSASFLPFPSSQSATGGAVGSVPRLFTAFLDRGGQLARFLRHPSRAVASVRRLAGLRHREFKDLIHFLVGRIATVARGSGGHLLDKFLQERLVGHLAALTEVNPTTDAPGFPGMHAVCQEIFGPVSRLCTGKEYALSLDVVGAPTSAGAWVHPGQPFGRAGIDCLGWAAVAGNSGGTIVTEFGGFEERACNSMRPVTCCGVAP